MELKFSGLVKIYREHLKSISVNFDKGYLSVTYTVRTVNDVTEESPQEAPMSEQWILHAGFLLINSVDKYRTRATITRS